MLPNLGRWDSWDSDFLVVVGVKWDVVAMRHLGLTYLGLDRGRFFERRNCCSVGEEDIEQAVIVVIEESYTADHGFERVALGADAVLESELDLGCLNYVLKLDRSYAARLGVLPAGRFRWAGKRLPGLLGMEDLDISGD